MLEDINLKQTKITGPYFFNRFLWPNSKNSNEHLLKDILIQLVIRKLFVYFLNFITDQTNINHKAYDIVLIFVVEICWKHIVSLEFIFFIIPLFKNDTFSWFYIFNENLFSFLRVYIILFLAEFHLIVASSIKD